MVKKKIDKMGRICLPKEMREQLGMDLDSDVVITIRENTIVIRKISGTCVICGASTHDDSMNICECCRARIVREALTGHRD